MDIVDQSPASPPRNQLQERQPSDPPQLQIRRRSTFGSDSLDVEMNDVDGRTSNGHTTTGTLMNNGSNGMETTSSSVAVAANNAVSSLMTTIVAPPPPPPSSNEIQQKQQQKQDQEKQRRASIQNIMRHTHLSALEKRRSIQFLMDGRALSAWKGRRVTIDCVSNTYLANGGANRRVGGDGGMMMDVSGGGGGVGISEHGQPYRRRSSSFDDRDRQQGGITSNNSGAVAATSFGHGTDTAPSWAAAAANAARSHQSSGKDDYDSDESIDEVALMTAAAIEHARLQTMSESFMEEDEPKLKSDVTTLDMSARTELDHIITLRECARRAIESAPPCTHYVRNNHIVSPCCGATFACRICHDECPVLPPLIKDQVNMRRGSTMTNMLSRPVGEHHKLPRFDIAEIICRECYTKQDSKTNTCMNCQVQFGEYHCDICNLWMANDDHPYHCPDCGFCRVGGGDNFKHCLDCGMCIDRQLFSNHNCKVGKYMSNCPVCQEDLFSSRDASHELPCGHAIHWHCFREMASHDNRCPVCKKTAETHDRMKPTWDVMAMSIALQPVPSELCKVVTIMCNDCEVVQENRAWHFLGVQCKECESFNTVVDRVTMIGREAHEYLLRMEPLPEGVVGADASDDARRMVGIMGAPLARGNRGNRPRRRRASTDAIPNPNNQAPPPPRPPFR